MALSHVNRSEREDFEVMLRRLGRLGEFDATDGAVEILAPPWGRRPTIYTVIVKSLHTGKTRTYTSGGSITNNGWAAWVNEVASDIEGGAFD